MKAKCRGYEGTLMSMNSDTEFTRLGGMVAYKYTLRIFIKNSEIVELYCVTDDEIEFINSEEEKNSNICHYLGDIRLEPIPNTENLYTIIGETISYQLVDEETGTKYIEEVAKRHSKIVL